LAIDLSLNLIVICSFFAFCIIFLDLIYFSFFIFLFFLKFRVIFIFSLNQILIFNQLYPFQCLYPSDSYSSFLKLIINFFNFSSSQISEFNFMKMMTKLFLFSFYFYFCLNSFSFFIPFHFTILADFKNLIMIMTKLFISLDSFFSNYVMIFTINHLNFLTSFYFYFIFTFCPISISTLSFLSFFTYCFFIKNRFIIFFCLDYLFSL